MGITPVLELFDEFLFRKPFTRNLVISPWIHSYISYCTAWGIYENSFPELLWIVFPSIYFSIRKIINFIMNYFRKGNRANLQSIQSIDSARGLWAPQFEVPHRVQRSTKELWCQFKDKFDIVTIFSEKFTHRGFR